MIVMGSEGINSVALHVRQDLLPAAKESHNASNLGFTAMCLDLIAEDYDRVVDVLVADHNEVANIFRDALPILDGDLRSRIDIRLAFEAENLRVRTLSQRADDDLRLLIELHDICDNGRLSTSHEGKNLNMKIWHFLGNYAERRRYQSPI